MFRSLLALALLVVLATVADAGPIRDRLAARKCGQVARPLAYKSAASSSSAASVVSGCSGGRCLMPLSNLPSGR